MERESQSPEQRQKALAQAYAISFYEFMDIFPRQQNLSWGHEGQYVEWITEHALVQIHEIEGDYSVIVSSGDTEIIMLEITRGYAEYAELIVIDTEQQRRIECRPMNIDDWHTLHGLIAEYDQWAQTWPPQQLTD